MSAGSERTGRITWLNPLLGVVLVAIAGLNTVLFAGIGIATWQRASLSELWLRMRQEDRLQEQGAQREARELRAIIAATQEDMAGTLRAIPSDTELAKSLAALSARATALGLTVTELSPLQPAPAATPVRRFAWQARGSWPQLLSFFTFVADSSLPTARLEEVTLQEQGELAQLSFEWVVITRPAALPAAGEPWDPTAVAADVGPRRQEQEPR